METLPAYRFVEPLMGCGRGRTQRAGHGGHVRQDQHLPRCISALKTPKTRPKLAKMDQNLAKTRPKWSVLGHRSLKSSRNPV